MRTIKGFVPALCIAALLGSTLACNLGITGQTEPYDAPQPGEPPMEEPPPEEPPMEEPPPQEPPPQEPPQQPQQQPTQSPGGAFSTDIAVTDIYPGKQPYGQFHLRITNHGPGTLNNVQVNVTCSSERTDKKTGKKSSGGNANFNVTLGMKPGETQTFPTTLTLDTTVFNYLVGCEVHPGFSDPKPGNNVYNETFK